MQHDTGTDHLGISKSRIKYGELLIFHAGSVMGLREMPSLSTRSPTYKHAAEGLNHKQNIVHGGEQDLSQAVIAPAVSGMLVRDNM